MGVVRDCSQKLSLRYYLAICGTKERGAGEMEGSGSGSGSGFNKKGREGLPPTAPRSSRRRRARDENPIPNDENPENPNLHPQPQQAEGSGQMETPAEQRARLANRRYSEAFRHRRQTRIQQLEAQVANLEAQNAQGNIEYQRQTTERSVNQIEIEALRRRREASKANWLAKQAETGRLNGKIERLARKIEAEDEETENIIKNNDPIYLFFDEMFTSVIHAFTPPFAGDPPPPAPPPGDDEAGPSRVNDSSSPDDSM
ncbi:hypothetical protein K1719_010748 [Acacia pycnantha]|nr:hypothetical protein K1719_010748 [Acacia pycnantha]